MEQISSQRVLLTRAPAPALRPFVKVLWAADERGCSLLPDADREHVLPTGTMHVVFRLSDHPLRLYRDAGDTTGEMIGNTLVGGARATFYIRDISRPASSVGVQFQPGGADLFLGVPAGELAGRHTALEDICGRFAEEARERLLEAGSPEKQLDILELLLAIRLPRVRGLHPAVAQALEQFTHTDNVREVVTEYGYSHRRFIELFQRAVGLTPKLYCRMLRFQNVLDRIAQDPDSHWVDLALSTGYSDQSHFNREFREFTGLTPGEYRTISPSFGHHVPIRRPALGFGEDQPR